MRRIITCCKLNVCTHKSVPSALAHPSVWAGIAGVLTSTGAELDKPYSVACFVLSACCSIAAILLRTPLEQPPVKEEVRICQR